MTSVPQTFSGAHNFDINNPIFNAYSSFHSTTPTGTVTANGSHTEPVYLDEIDAYVRLLHGRNGYPLWEPKQRSGEGVLQLPDEYRKEGVRIGDIGILSKTGDFDYFFNACLPADHPVNQGRVPQDFIQLDIDIRNAYSKEVKAGFIANNTSHFNHRILEGISDLQSPYVDAKL
ncbi:hypothetical protein BT96DRAFT_864578 [Gymnopus androsaceus JB14]|uniref:Uncharacterized protein n=1 Tax=Gymnopus androsaceus JB14 TaxID=1447944 RepID=A0A6A4H3S8_9AGAR|nr:hypothetical protein BT96DRAFT_864578 [Gymnopus androsaceus JB14]